MKPFVTSINGIITDWLSVKENRQRIPHFYCDQSVFDFCVSNCDIYNYGKDEVYIKMNNTIFNLVVNEEAHHFGSALKKKK